MPTHDEADSFWHDWDKLTEAQQDQFLVAVAKMVDDIRLGQGFRKGLRVKGVQRRPGTYEMTWADDGRAIFEYGLSPRAGDTHIIWRRVGTHDILKNP